MFVLQAQNEEMMGERSTYQKYVAQLKNRIAQLEEKLQEAEDGDGEERGRRRGRGREEVLRLRREKCRIETKERKTTGIRERSESIYAALQTNFITTHKTLHTKHRH